ASTPAAAPPSAAVVPPPAASMRAAPPGCVHAGSATATSAIAQAAAAERIPVLARAARSDLFRHQPDGPVAEDRILRPAVVRHLLAAQRGEAVGLHHVARLEVVALGEGGGEVLDHIARRVRVLEG